MANVRTVSIPRSWFGLVLFKTTQAVYAVTDPLSRWSQVLILRWGSDRMVLGQIKRTLAGMGLDIQKIKVLDQTTRKAFEDKMHTELAKNVSATGLKN